ncbi:Sugar lactone lactonase YvrE [Amycolatopsis marina]|uniref:Sugar lactone lactonase YvrE n=1 Tax=Amycolatopsis marina TaxID=490629 RepID=A0A1I1BH77_9PSEU|nr:SMP-30/gluconolactonase/LRE family protein [Amycolatopsis marina]SFB48118.1 Sugar lactone lactonase YvrE [Amycolatopsis marina]
MNVRRAEIVRDGFQYLEGFRWHGGEVWFSDIPLGKVYRMKPDGSGLNLALDEPIHPSGLGFPATGETLVVGQADNTLRRILPTGGSVVVADLNDVAVGANDMWVAPNGRAYISQIGFDLFTEEPKPSHVVIVHPDGTIETAGEDMWTPNGIQLTADGTQLVVAESFANRLTLFDVDANGGLANQRVFRQFEDPQQEVLDGLVIDAEGGIWVAVPFEGEVRRVAPDGKVTDKVKTHTEGHLGITCALGGADRRTLYIAAADTQMETLFDGTARVEAARVDIPGIDLEPSLLTRLTSPLKSALPLSGN